MTTGTVKPQHPNIASVQSQRHTFNGLVADPTGWEVKGSCSEKLLVSYLSRTGFDEISEDHAWKSPVDRFELTVRAPEGYRVGAKTLSQHPLKDLVGGAGPHERIYRVGAIFAHQGFKWSIARTD